MYRATAGLVAVILNWNRQRAHVGIGPPGNGLTLDVGAQILALEVAQLVMRIEILRGQARAALEQGKASEFAWPSAQAFFNTLRTHTMEGMFADPVYGGNKDFSGWLLVGFPGAQPLFSPADLASKEAFGGAPIIGLQAQRGT